MNGGKQINFWWQIDADVASLHVCVCVRLCWGYFQWQCRRNLGPRETGKRGRKTHPESPGTAEPDIKEEKKRKQKKKAKKKTAPAGGGGKGTSPTPTSEGAGGGGGGGVGMARRRNAPSPAFRIFMRSVRKTERRRLLFPIGRKKKTKKPSLPLPKCPAFPSSSSVPVLPSRLSGPFCFLHFSFLFFFQFLKTIFLLLAGWKRARGNIREPCRSARFPNVFFLLRSDQNIAWNWMMTLWVHFDELELPPTIPSISRRDRLAEWQYLFFLFKWIQRELFRLPKLGQNSTFSVAFTGFLAPSFRCQMPKAKHFDNEKSFIYRYLMSTIDS